MSTKTGSGFFKMSTVHFYIKPGFILIMLLCMLVSVSCAKSSVLNNVDLTQPPDTIPPVSYYTYKIINTYPHQKDAFTQGLVYENGTLYEGTGLYGKSSLRKNDLSTGQVLQIYELPAQYFGEGITLYKDTVIQLTWKSNRGFIYDKQDFNLLSEFSYPTEGWGLTHDARHLIMSDGTSSLYRLDFATLETIESVQVKDNGVPVDLINELEYVNGRVFANIWQTNNIAIINPEDGQVTGWIDLSGLLQTQDFSGPVDVLNGIAYDTRADRLFVTGKLWPFLFEIKLVVKET
jgi:glutamine cyclotransferase